MLRKPSFTPPGSYFGPTWTLLYALMGASLLGHPQRGEDGAAKGASRTLFGAQLLLNVLWTYVFFGRRAPGWAFVEVVFLLAAIAATAASDGINACPLPASVSLFSQACRKDSYP
jgi:tryptophan-rich sensory protein